jgi:hypothetical protein
MASRRFPVGLGTSKYCVMFSVMHCQGSGVSVVRDTNMVVTEVACLAASKGSSVVVGSESARYLADACRRREVSKAIEKDFEAHKCVGRRWRRGKGEEIWT